MTIPESESPIYPEPSVPPAPPTNSLAIASLLSGILAWLGVFGIGGILAVIFGHMAKNEIRNSPEPQSGDGLATAGLVLGYINIAIVVIGLCLFFTIFGGSMAILGFSLFNR